MYEGALLSSVLHPDWRVSTRRIRALGNARKSAGAALQAQGASVPDVFVGQSVGRWSKPFLAVANHAANGLLRLRGYRHRMVRVPTGHMHAMVCKGSGSMPPVVMLPGLGTRIGDYMRLLWRLKPNFRGVIAIDLPGHGKSQLHVPMNSQAFANAILDAKVALVPEPAFMLGHSLGGLGTMKSYLLAPHEVLAMTLVTPPGGPTPPDLVKQYRGQFDIHSWREAQVIADMSAPRTCWPHLITPAVIGQRLTAAPVRELLLSDVLTAHVTPSELAQMPRHTMFVWAGRERLLPAAHRRYFLRHLPRTTHVWEPAHMAHQEIALGAKKNIKPIIKFFQGAARDLAGGHAPNP